MSGRAMAESMGVNTANSRMAIFVLAALQACASGWLYAHMQRFLNPTPFSLHTGIEYLFMAVVGGAGQVWGALLGATVITVSKQWLQDLRDQQARARIRIRLDRLALGNFGDCEPVGGGVIELRIDWGPGYRVYCTRLGQVIVLLLCGGDKKTQKNILKQAGLVE